MYIHFATITWVSCSIFYTLKKKIKLMINNVDQNISLPLTKLELINSYYNFSRIN